MSKAQATLIEDDSAFLLSFADDTEESPWMVAADPHLLALTALISIAQLYAADHRPDLYVSGELAVRFPKADGTVGQVAPDLLAAYAPRRLRGSFDVTVEGGFPAFVLEVVSPASARRDCSPRRGLSAPFRLSARWHSPPPPSAMARIRFTTTGTASPSSSAIPGTVSPASARPPPRASTRRWPHGARRPGR